LLQLCRADTIKRIDGKVKLTTTEGGGTDGEEANTKTVRKTLNFDDADIAGSYLLHNGCRHVRVEFQEKAFKASSVTNLTDFFERFRALNIGSNAELDEIVIEAQQAVEGVDAKGLRKKSLGERSDLRAPLANLSERLEDMIQDRPRRQISLTDDE
jgi:hypothetical protein